jgi:hypothetical protein
MTTITIDAAQRQRLAAILGMLGSDHAGERAAAGLQAEKFRRQHGLTWAELLALEPEPRPAPEPPAQPAWTPPKPPERPAWMPPEPQAAPPPPPPTEAPVGPINWGIVGDMLWGISLGVVPLGLLVLLPVLLPVLFGR